MKVKNIEVRLAKNYNIDTFSSKFLLNAKRDINANIIPHSTKPTVLIKLPTFMNVLT